MEVLVFKTNIEETTSLDKIKSVFNNMWQIREWSVDLEDEDKVLRIESVHLSGEKVKGLISDLGIHCDDLLD